MQLGRPHRVARFLCALSLKTWSSAGNAGRLCSVLINAAECGAGKLMCVSAACVACGTMCVYVRIEVVLPPFVGRARILVSE